MPLTNFCANEIATVEKLWGVRFSEPRLVDRRLGEESARRVHGIVDRGANLSALFIESRRTLARVA